jgi:type II secretory pathway pseudopilin PulG
MKRWTLVAIVVVLVVAVVLVSGMGLFPNSSNGAKNKTATLTINFYDASTDHFQHNITTWTNSSGTWSYETHASGNETTQFVFVNVTFSSNVLDLLTECSKIGSFSVGKQTYIGMGTLIQSIDGVANENPGRGWQYYVNGTYGQVACDKTTLNGGEVVAWKFITLQGN